MQKIGLVIEGGGFRGIFTAGFLDFFLENEIEFPYVIGVSMGACNGANYISKQKKRSIAIPYDFIDDDRYISFKNLLKDGNLFGMDFIFHEIPYEHNLFDFKTFKETPQTFLITAMDCISGETFYFNKEKLSDKEALTALKASCSLPLISKMVSLQGRRFLDGGLSDSIPIQKAIEDGMDKVVVLLTRERGYRKKPSKSNFLLKQMYKKYPKVLEAIETRHVKYNDTLDLIERLEKEGRVLALYPEKAIPIGRTERNKDKLMAAYEAGYQQALKMKEQIIQFIERS